MLNSFTSSLSRSSSTNFDALTEELSKLSFTQDIKREEGQESRQAQQYVSWLRIFFDKGSQLRDVFESEGEIKFQVRPEVANELLEDQILMEFQDEIKALLKVYERSGVNNYPSAQTQFRQEISLAAIEDREGYAEIKNLLEQSSLTIKQIKKLFMVQLLHICYILFAKSKDALLFTRLSQQNVKKLANKGKKNKKPNNFQKYFDAFKIENPNQNDLDDSEFLNLQKMVREVLKLEEIGVHLLTLKEISFMLLTLVLAVLIDFPLSKFQNFYRFLNQFMFKKYVQVCEVPLNLGMLILIDLEGINFKQAQTALDQLAEALTQDILTDFQNLQLKTTASINFFYVFFLDSLFFLRESISNALRWKTSLDQSKSRTTARKKKNKKTIAETEYKFACIYDQMMENGLKENLMVYQVLKKKNKKERKKQKMTKLLQDEALNNLLLELKNTKIDKENRMECYGALIEENMARWRKQCAEEIKRMK